MSQHGFIDSLLCVAAPLRFLLLILLAAPAAADDWPMWRHDPGRTGVTAQKLPEKPSLRWFRQYPELRPAFGGIRQERVQFDLGYEPVVLGKRMFVGSSLGDSVTALDTESGAELWRFFADGPVRLAPAAWENRVYFCSDDGYLYCLDAVKGQLLWKHRTGPSNRKVFGNGRMISAWPARGGPVVCEGRVYVAAGIWPFEGIFVWALDARTGKVLWLNDQTGSMYCEHPHGAMSFGGPSPQGYLLVRQGELVVPSGRAFPAFYDLATGNLNNFEFGHGGHGSRPGSWFVATDAQGRLCVDPAINNEMHDAGQQVIGQVDIRHKPGEPIMKEVQIGRNTYQIAEGASSQITAGGRTFRYADGLPGVAGPIHTMLAADGKLFAVTRSGGIYCFAAEQGATKPYSLAVSPLPGRDDRWRAKLKQAVALAGTDEGLALVWGIGSGRLLEELIIGSKFQVVVAEPDPKKVLAWREKLAAAGLYGGRVAILPGEPLGLGLPPYWARLIVAEEEPRQNLEGILDFVSHTLRPYGSVALLPMPSENLEHVKNTAVLWRIPGLAIRPEGECLVFRRDGPLEGAADYRGAQNFDEMVRAPLRLLWFGDNYHHHKLFYRGFLPETGRGLPPTITVAGGVMRYEVPREPHGIQPPKIKYLDYLEQLAGKEHQDVDVDVYTGLPLAGPQSHKTQAAAQVPESPWPVAVARRNPITGILEAREYLKTYGCDQWGADYGNVITLRSGTAAFYDCQLESGTINISGVRSACRNSVVPADGLLLLPSWTGNCTCNYPLYTSLALAPAPEEFEQWAAWGPVAADAPVRRVGINFGAPGDRMTRSGTLWLDWPSRGGPSPDVPVEVKPETAQPYYRHSGWFSGDAWPWVASSGIQGVESIRIGLVARRPRVPGGTFSVRWTGWVQAPAGESYTFYVRTDERARLWLGEKLLLDNSKSLRRGDGQELAGKIELAAGVKTPIRLEYFRRSDVKQGGALLELSWSSPSLAKQLIPSDRLIGAHGRAGGLTSSYYEGSTLVGPALLQDDRQMRFDWGKEYPAVLRRAFAPVRVQRRSFTVRMYFAEPEELLIGRRVFSVAVQGREVLPDFDIVREAGGVRRGIVRELKGVEAADAMAVTFRPATAKPPLICGIELIEE